MVIEFFVVFILDHHYQLEERYEKESLFLEMKNYSFDFNDERFDTDIVNNDNSKLYELLFDKSSVYILVPLGKKMEDILKIYYPIEAYQAELKKRRLTLYWQFFIFTLVSLFMALLFSYYSLRPLRNSLRLLEEFIKDIIHDLNTPISSILLNLEMMKRDEASKSIEHNTKSIAMLHKNLDSYLRESPIIKEPLLLKELVSEQVAFFQPLYDYLEWNIVYDESIVDSDKNALSRIVYNLISNACKYNTNDGQISITVKEHKITIKNDSYGVKNPSKVFNRFYKEGERGLGIGLHIVQKLTDQLHIKKSFTVVHHRVTVSLEIP